jgi:dTDP-4-amino-4,6-dideoxy-D-galactose acyltransferase
VDLRITLQLEDRIRRKAVQHRGLAGITIRVAQPSDIPQLEQIAARNHRDSRFYSDGHFPAEACDRLYATWVRRSCEGVLADIVFVPDKGDGPIGYLTQSVSAEGKGSIGLVGIREDLQSQGIGTALMSHGLEWFQSIPIDHVEVVTQGRNLAAQRAYQKMGFITGSTKLWYHKWFETNSSASADR